MKRGKRKPSVAKSKKRRKASVKTSGKKLKFKPTLDPEEPGLDEMTRKRRRALAKLEAMTVDELFEVAVMAGIYTRDGKLTKPYRRRSPSPYRPTG